MAPVCDSSSSSWDEKRKLSGDVAVKFAAKKSSEKFQLPPKEEFPSSSHETAEKCVAIEASFAQKVVRDRKKKSGEFCCMLFGRTICSNARCYTVRGRSVKLKIKWRRIMRGYI